jgi:hypothetical protein
MTSARRNAEVRSAHAAKQGVSFRADNACAGGASATPVIGDFNNISREKGGEWRDGAPEECRSNHQER